MQLLNTSKCYSRWIKSWSCEKEKYKHEKGQMTSSLEAILSLCVYLWRMRVKNSWNKSGHTQTGMLSAHTHKVISTDRNYNIPKLSEKCVWLSIQPGSCTQWFPLMWITEETLWRKICVSLSIMKAEIWQWVWTLSSHFFFSVGI
jgi:hypothetical protein